MPLKYGNGQYIQSVEGKFLIFDDDLPFAADDKIDLIVQVPVRARALARRDFRHHDPKRLAMKADARIDDISELAHSGRLEHQILLLHENLALTPELLFVHGERHLFRVELSSAIPTDFSIIDFSTSAGDQRVPRVLAFL